MKRFVISFFETWRTKKQKEIIYIFFALAVGLLFCVNGQAEASGSVAMRSASIKFALLFHTLVNEGTADKQDAKDVPSVYRNYRDLSFLNIERSDIVFSPNIGVDIIETTSDRSIHRKNLSYMNPG